MLKCCFVTTTLIIIIAGTLADVPLKQFDNLKYKISKTDGKNFKKAIEAFDGLDDPDMRLKWATNVVLKTPETETGKYMLSWRDALGAGLDEEFILNEQPAKPEPNMRIRLDTYKVEGNKLITSSRISPYEGTLTRTMEFEVNQLTVTHQIGEITATQLYKLNK